MKIQSIVFKITILLILMGSCKNNEITSSIDNNSNQGIQTSQTNWKPIDLSILNNWPHKYAIIKTMDNTSPSIEYFKFNNKEEILNRIIIEEAQNKWYWRLLTPGEEFEVLIENCMTDSEGLFLTVNSPEPNTQIIFKYTSRDSGLGKWEFPAFNNGKYEIVIAEDKYLNAFQRTFPYENK